MNEIDVREHVTLAADRPHIAGDQFKSDKYAWCPPGFVPLKLSDKYAQPVLRWYANLHRPVDAQFSDDLIEALRLAGAPEMNATIGSLHERDVAERDATIAAQAAEIERLRREFASAVEDVYAALGGAVPSDEAVAEARRVLDEVRERGAST